MVAVHILGGIGLKEVAEETAAAAVQDDDNDVLLGDFHSGGSRVSVGLKSWFLVFMTFLMVSR